MDNFPTGRYKLPVDRGNSLLRFFDSSLGPWLLRGLSFFWGPKPDRFGTLVNSVEDKPFRIGFLKAAAIGDTVLFSGPLLDFQKRYPKAEIFLFVGASNLGLAKALPPGFQVVLLPLKSPLASLWILRKQKLDFIVDGDSWPRISALLAALSGAKARVGFQTAGQNRHYCFDRTVEHSAQVHELENYRTLIRVFKVPTGLPPFDFGGREAGELVGLHLWPGGTLSHLKEWPLERWAQLIGKLSEQNELQFVLTGAPSERSKNQNLISLLPTKLQGRVYNGAGGNLEQSLQLIRQMKLLISVNTGILHLAAAVGVPVLGLHGPTNPRRWGPWGGQHISVVSEHPLAGKLNLGFEYDGMDGVMEQLSLPKVLAGLAEVSRKNDLGLKIVHS